MINKTKQYEEKYIHIQKRSLTFFLLTIVLLALTIGSFKITLSSWNFLGLGNLESYNYYPYQLIIIPMLILDYILASLTICSFASIFKKLKKWNEEGLIACLIAGLIVGLIGGLIVGLILFLILGLIAGLIKCLIACLIAGLIIGWIWGLIGGLIVSLFAGLDVGLEKEFKK